MIGGLTPNSPGVEQEAGITGAYLKTRFVVGVPPFQATFDDQSPVRT